MTKAEELKILEKIEALIKSAGVDSYIGPTFAGIVEVCRENIESDFGNHPLEDLALARQDAENAKDATKEALAELDKLKAEYDALAGAYREAVEASEAARPYAIEASREAQTKLDELDEDADGGTIACHFRMLKKARRAVFLTHVVQEKMWTYRPLFEEENA